MTTTRKPWTPTENAALVSLYFDMLRLATTGGVYNKAAMIREASEPTHPAGFKAKPWTGELRERSKGSIEAKLMNASACHRDLVPSADTMDGHGYRAWGNYQATLREAMALALDERGEREIA